MKIANIQQSSLLTMNVAEIMARAYERHLLVPAFNIAYLPMMSPIIRTLKEHDTFALVEIARPDIEYFGAESYEAVAATFAREADRSVVRLHQDHVPVLDEHGQAVEWELLIQQALALGYDSVMLDGSRLSLEENIAATKAVVAMAHPAVAVEGELGAVLGHENSPLPPYEVLFGTGQGFTDSDEVACFVGETGVDWLSVAAGNVHGAVAGMARDEEKIEARLDVAHVRRVSARAGIPLVMHGGTAIELTYVLEAAANGLTKVNVGTAVRQPYEAVLRQGGSEAEAQAAVAEAVVRHICDYGIAGSAARLAAG